MHPYRPYRRRRQLTGRKLSPGVEGKATRTPPADQTPEIPVSRPRAGARGVAPKAARSYLDHQGCPDIPASGVP